MLWVLTILMLYCLAETITIMILVFFGNTLGLENKVLLNLSTMHVGHGALVVIRAAAAVQYWARLPRDMT